jgi:hypothetical protein
MPSKSSKVLKPDTYVKAATAQPKETVVYEPDMPAEDEPTIFTSFMTFYLGFFGITLAVYPWAFAADGAIPNPMPYWTTISDELAFGFRIAGIGFLTLVIGPYLDDIFGGAGVAMSAFARQMFVANLLTLLVFTYYTFWAPLDTIIPAVWMGQTYFAAFLVGWSVIEIAGKDLAYFYTLFTSLEFGGFSLCLMSVPALLFGDASPFTYWHEWPETALMTARFLGSVMFAVFVLGYYLQGNKAGYCKTCTLWNVGITALTVVNAYFGGSSSNPSMWEIQICMQIPFVVIGLYLELTGSTGGFALASLAPKPCGGNVATYNLASFIWLIGFVPIMYSDPNLIMGPNSITGFPMFLQELTETALWFGKAWALAVTLMVSGPYLFGFDHLKVAKQNAFGFLAFSVIFGVSWFVYPGVMNPITMLPLAGVNVLLGIFGLVVVLPGNNGGASMF